MLFDLDGVLTTTAQLHARCWQRAFNEFLATETEADPVARRPFERPDEYLRFVDGKPRYDGARAWLASRGFWIPDGTPADPPTRRTVCGLGNRKSRLFMEALDTEGVDVYPDAVALVDFLTERDIRRAVVSSSRHCRAILEAARLADRFELQVDGTVAQEVGFAGKPAPDPFLYAARQLGVTPMQAAVIEDAVAGVRAGRAGGFGVVIGIDRGGGAAGLQAAGADLVVDDLRRTMTDPAAAPGKD